MKIYKKICFILILISILYIDIISKIWITSHLLLYESKKITSILNLYNIHNYGAIFGIFSNIKIWEYDIFKIFSFIIILIMLKITILSKKNITLSYLLIISGAISNLFNRIYYSFVIDFIDIHIKNWHFATFNIADISIFIGIILFLKYDL
ncbi:MAG TPA: signal peptidase II [Buchnera sp. (in: enterobacteria)]|nr:signal peptidase II [Buchnera sp. (in: enterobacteria)]